MCKESVTEPNMGLFARMQQSQPTGTGLQWRKVQSLLQASSKENWQLVLKDSDSLMTVREKVLKAPSGGRVATCGLFSDWLVVKVTQWHFESLSHQPSGSNQKYLCLWSPSFIRGGVLFLGGQLRCLSDCYISLLRSNWNSVLLLICCYYFPCLIAFPLFLHFLTSLISSCLSLFFETQGRLRRLKSFSTNKKQGTERGFCA